MTNTIVPKLPIEPPAITVTHTAQDAAETKPAPQSRQLDRTTTTAQEQLAPPTTYNSGSGKEAARPPSFLSLSPQIHSQYTPPGAFTSSMDETDQTAQTEGKFLKLA
jgi:hypothetical protein